jgi:hypothetical protein
MEEPRSSEEKVREIFHMLALDVCVTRIMAIDPDTE